jgi:hypothetical protein
MLRIQRNPVFSLLKILQSAVVPFQVNAIITGFFKKMLYKWAAALILHGVDFYCTTRKSDGSSDLMPSEGQ